MYLRSENIISKKGASHNHNNTYMDSYSSSYHWHYKLVNFSILIYCSENGSQILLHSTMITSISHTYDLCVQQPAKKDNFLVHAETINVNDIWSSFHYHLSNQTKKCNATKSHSCKQTSVGLLTVWKHNNV